MAYPCDLPANMGNTDIFRAIYAKLDNIQPGTHIEEKLDYLIGQVDDVNSNIQLNTEAIAENTKAIKDISINISSEDLHSIAIAITNQTEVLSKQTQAIKDISVNVVVDAKDLSEHIDKVSHSIDMFNSSLNATLQNIQPGPQPRPIPPRPHPHPVPPPPIVDDVIFYPVQLSLPEPKPIVIGSRCAGNTIFKHHYNCKKVSYKSEPIKQKKDDVIYGRCDDMIFRDSPVYKSRVEEAKMKYNSIKPRYPVKK